MREVNKTEKDIHVMRRMLSTLAHSFATVEVPRGPKGAPRDSGKARKRKAARQARKRNRR